MHILLLLAAAASMNDNQIANIAPSRISAKGIRIIRLTMMSKARFKPRPTGLTATVAGLRVPVVDTPIAQMADRHDYPIPPTTLVPIARVK